MSAPTESLGLEGRVVLVTGAGRGLGRAYAETLARQGAQVVLHDGGVDQLGGSPDPSVAEAVAEGIRAEGGQAKAVTEVLSDAASCRRVVAAALESQGRLDGLIHSAGLVIRGDLADLEEPEVATSNAVNSEAAIWLCAAALPAMRAQGYGRIVLTTSGWGLTPSKGSDRLTLYSHGKGAQFGLAMALAEGAGHEDIKTNAISPIANTRIFTGPVDEGRLRPEMVAGAVVWLASPACKLTGCLVKAADGEVEIQKIATVASRTLGEAAADPVATGAALRSMGMEVASGSLTQISAFE